MEMEYLRKGPWFEEEDEQLKACVSVLGERRWDSIAKISGLRRSGKSCRLRWLNYLRPNLKQGPITSDEELIILQLHERWGNKWAKIARRLHGRTDNEIKNYWRTHLRRKLQNQNQNNTQFLSIIPFNTNISSSSIDQTKNSNQDNTLTTQVNINAYNEEQLVYTYTYNNNNNNSNNNNNETKDEVSNYLITNLPYENYISHCMSNSLPNEVNDESSVECMGYNASGICYDNPITLNQEYDGACDYSYGLWDMDYFNVARFAWGYNNVK